MSKIIMTIKNKPRINLVKLVVTIISVIFSKKTTFKVATFRGSLFSECCYFWHLLTPVKFYHYFRRVATFGRSLLWELYGNPCCNYNFRNF